MFRTRSISDATAEEHIYFLILEPGNTLVPAFVAVSRLCKFPTSTSGRNPESVLPATLRNDCRQ